MVATGDTTSVPPAQGPLVGVRVIDLGTAFAGPFTATLLGDFGADVIKVELPGRGDTNRNVPPIVKGIGGAWTILARNKRSISLDIRKERGKELLKKLVARADVVVENFRPGTMERWGLGYEVLKEANPRIILVRISGYGQTGPYAEKTAFGSSAAAFSGLTYTQGFPDRPPVNPPAALVDYLAGTVGAFAAAMALYYLKAHDAKEGQQVDLALYEAAFRMLEPMVADYGVIGKVRERSGLALANSVPAGTFRCKDGKWVVMVTPTDPTFARLAETMGRADLLKDPRFDTNPHRVEHREEIMSIVQDWFSTQTMEEAAEKLDRNGVSVSSINSAADLFRHPHSRARENFVEVEHPILGKVSMPGIIPKLSSTPGAIRFPGPIQVGEHNLEIYQDELGLSQEELDSLRADAVI